MAKAKIVFIGVAAIALNVILALVLFTHSTESPDTDDAVASSSGAAVLETGATTHTEASAVLPEHVQSEQVPEEPVRSFVVPVTATGTVYDAMRALEADRADSLFSGEEYPGLGFFLTHVQENGGDRGEDWFLYINEIKSGRGASTADVVPGDRVEWKLEDRY